LKLMSGDVGGPLITSSSVWLGLGEKDASCTLVSGHRFVECQEETQAGTPPV
jgi:hypothetical protein